MTTKQSLLTGFAPGINLPSSVCVGHSDIPSSSAAHNLGVILDSQLALKEQVNIRYQLAYLEIKRFSSIRRYLSSEVTKTVVSSLVLSRLDNCNTVLAGFPQVLLDRIQRVINCSARPIGCTAPKSVHIIPLLYGRQLATSQQPDSIQNSSHLFPHCLWYSSSIPLWVASSLLTLFAQEDPGGKILSIHRTCDLEFSSSLCQALFFILFLLV